MPEERQNDGIIVKKAHPNAPKFVKCKLSFNVNNFINTLQQNNINGWVNMDVKLSQKGDLYAEIDNWQPNQQQAPPQQPQQGQQYQQQPQGQPQNQGYQQPPQQPNYNQGPTVVPPQPPQQDGGYGFNPNEDIPFAPCH